ncbi:MAG: YmfQ family protein [Proteobacteria bacterium]|nr:YmfQ family protein [Pseudomonadota bacterium]
MSNCAENIYQLLPAIHRIRDAEQGYPLRELLALIAEQVAAIEENLDQLYDDQFIETCAQWVAPYIGDLIGYRSLHGVVPGVASPRADVANTIRYRRRKGTASMLEQVARDVTGWPARTVEFFQLLAWTQHMNHRRPQVHYAPDLRRGQKLQWLNTAFNSTVHTAEVRSISRGSGRYNIPNIGIFLWRVRAFPLTRTPALADATLGEGLLLRFDPLGRDLPLYNKAESETEISHLAEPINTPLPLDRRWLKAHLDEYYGPGKSLALELASATPGQPPQLIAAKDISICNLSDISDGGGTVTGWAHQPLPGSVKVAIDPVLGRIALGTLPTTPLLATFHYGFTLAIGGGEYERGSREPSASVQSVSGGATLQTALNAVRSGGTVEVSDSYRYQETPNITVDPGASVTLRAKNSTRPLLVASADINLNLGPDSTLILDGWVITGAPLKMADFGDDEPRQLILRDCTLVPSSAHPAMSVAHPFATVKLERCISGPLHIAADAEIELDECIVDATDPEKVAYRAPGPNELEAGGAMTLENCTVIGKVHSRQIPLASNCLFVSRLSTEGAETWRAPLWVERRQKGCIRFSFVPHGSRTPRHYRCQPEAGQLQTRPHFTSLRYGDAGYCQLRQATPDSICRGADDEGEMGVMHGLYQPQRETNLQVRLEEYLRFGLEAGIFYAS